MPQDYTPGPTFQAPGRLLDWSKPGGLAHGAAGGGPAPFQILVRENLLHRLELADRLQGAHEVGLSGPASGPRRCLRTGEALRRNLTPAARRGVKSAAGVVGGTLLLRNTFVTTKKSIETERAHRTQAPPPGAPPERALAQGTSPIYAKCFGLQDLPTSPFRSERG